jgi:hypothetical protein
MKPGKDLAVIDAVPWCRPGRNLKRTHKVRREIRMRETNPGKPTHTHPG